MKILWIRHGFTCANFLNHVDPFYVLTGTQEYDTRLTKLGYEQARESVNLIRSVIKDYKIVEHLFTSTLTRSIETAIAIKQNYIFSEFLITPLPYIEEIPFTGRVNSNLTILSRYGYIDKQNEPRNHKEVEKELDIKLDILNVNDELNPYEKDGTPNYNKIVNKEKFLNNVLPELKNKFESENEETILIVISHKNTIGTITGIENIGNMGMILYDTESKESKIISYGYDHNINSDNIKVEDLENSRTDRVYDFFIK